MSSEVVAPISPATPNKTTFHDNQRGKSLPTVVFRVNSNGSASFDLDDEEFTEPQEVNSNESEQEDAEFFESLEIHLDHFSGNTAG